MSNVFVFNPDDFKLTFPQFAKYTNEQLQWFFDSIEYVVDNSEASCISLKNRKVWFYLLVAHEAELQSRIDDGNSALVGRITSASEGSVSISSEYPMGSGAMEQWLKSTPYGSKFYAISAPWRTALWLGAEAPMPTHRNKLRFWGW